MGDPIAVTRTFVDGRLTSVEVVEAPPNIEGPDICNYCVDDRTGRRCLDCGSFHVHNNFACGDPECCGENLDYCVACRSERTELAP